MDFILGKTLGEIAEDEETLDELLITLPECRHVFTVETLDGLCGMGDYYTQSQTDGTWEDLKSPVTQTQTGERKKPPVCPTCRSAITSPRYGRVYKSADLEILERNVISRMSTQLDSLRTSMDSIVKADIESKLTNKAPGITLESVDVAGSVRKACRTAQKAILGDKGQGPIPPEALDAGNESLFMIAPSVTKAWKDSVKPLMSVYERAIKVTGMRSAHMKAWEAAWSCLVEQEMERALMDPARAPQNLNQYAMQMARMKVGQPQPRGDKRFLVEAFWTAIQVRLVLSDLACAWLTATSNNSDYSPQQKQMWGNFAMFLLKGCQRDALIALDIATKSETRRQMTKTSLLIMRIDLESCRLNHMLYQHSGTLTLADQRSRLADDALKAGDEVDKDIFRICKEHFAVLPDDRWAWMIENFMDAANAIRDEWRKLEKSVRAETFYQPVSLDEKMNIVKALDFGYTGHFYNCPNGHTFVITECGGAMQQGRCPECGAVIGGSDHTLDSSNTRATDFEDLVRQAGARQSPFAWGR